MPPSAPPDGLFSPALSCLKAADSFLAGALDDADPPPPPLDLFAIIAAAAFAARLVSIMGAPPDAPEEVEVFFAGGADFFGAVVSFAAAGLLEVLCFLAMCESFA